jgi:methylmalonyl-CoA/ethylmalonyl-CoA epimerase
MTGIQGVDHIAVAVEDLDAATALWRDRFGLEMGPREKIPDQGVEVQVMFAGPVRIELMRPLGPDSPVARFLEKKGPGIHHIALAVDDCGAAREAALADGGRPAGEGPVPGAGGTKVAFLHPASAGGVLVEWVERTPEGS